MKTSNTRTASDATAPKVPRHPESDRANISVTPIPGGTGTEIRGSFDQFRQMGGSTVDAFNNILLRETLATVWCQNTEEDTQSKRIAAVAAALKAFDPKDEIEAMLAAQAVALHFGAMECLRRAMIKDQPFEYATKLRKDGTNLARGMTDMLEALDRKRGKGPQIVRVERVVVSEGGRAIVGTVATGGCRGGGG